MTRKIFDLGFLPTGDPDFVVCGTLPVGLPSWLSNPVKARPLELAYRPLKVINVRLRKG